MYESEVCHWSEGGGLLVLLVGASRSRTSICSGRGDHVRELGYLVNGSQELDGALSKIGSNVPFPLLAAASWNSGEYAVRLLDQSIVFPV